MRKITGIPLVILSTIAITAFFCFDYIKNMIIIESFKEIALSIAHSFAVKFMYHLTSFSFVVIGSSIFFYMLYYFIVSYRGYWVIDKIRYESSFIKTLNKKEKKRFTIIDKKDSNVVSYNKRTLKIFYLSIILFIVIFSMLQLTFDFYEAYSSQLDVVDSKNGVTSQSVSYDYAIASIVLSKVTIYNYTLPIGLLLISIMRTLLHRYYHASYYRFAPTGSYR